MPTVIEITGRTRRMAEDQPEYFTLPIRDEVMQGAPVMTSAWRFTDEELVQLMMGGTLELSILGSVHPPVMLAVKRVAEAPGKN